MPSQEEDTVPLSQWSQGGRGNSNNKRKRLILLPSVWESLAPHLGLVGLLSLMIWKDHLSLWDFLKAYWEISNCYYFSPSPFYLKRLSLMLEMCVGHLSIFRLRRDNLLYSLNNREASLAHDTKQVLFYCVARPLSEEGPSQWDSECLWEWMWTRVEVSQGSCQSRSQVVWLER